MDPYINLKKKSSKNNQVEFSAEIPAETIADHEKHELAHFGRDFSVPGFRKGKVPENILREHINPIALLQEAVESAIRVALRDIAEAEDIDVIGTPKVSIASIAPNKPIEFTAQFAINPAIELPDYKTIGQEIFTQKDEVAVTEKEIDDAILEIRKMSAKDEKEMPELNDAFVEKLGAPVKTVPEFKEVIKQELLQAKTNEQHKAKHAEVIKAIVEKSKLTIPELILEHELDHFHEQRDAEFKRMGITLETYLKDTKKTEKALDAEERAAIEDRLKTSLVFNEIQQKENLTADKREIDDIMKMFARRYPNEDPNVFRRNAEATIIERKIFALFEGKGEEEPAAVS